jgi:growth factor-regulated tyrosine kinase substrate
MLEERLSSAYSQQNLGYGAIPGAAQYPTMPGVSSHAPDLKSGAENYYYTNAPDTPRASTYAPRQVSNSGYDAPFSGVTSPGYPQPAPNNWGQNPYPSLGSPPPQGNAIPNHPVPPGSSGAPQYYAPQPEQDPSQSQFSETPYHPSPVMRRDSQYQASAPPVGPSAPEPHSPEQVHSPTYSNVPPAGPALQQQPPGAPPQSHYYQPQQPSTVPSAYPPMSAGQPGAFPDAPQTQPSASHQPARPVEESLIEL